MSENKQRKWIFLTEESKTKLQSIYPGIHNHKKANHITLESPLVSEDGIGQLVKFSIVGYAKNDLVEAVAVELPSNIHCDNKVPHITISFSDNANPKESNTLLEQNYQQIEPIELEGHIDIQLEGLKDVNKIKIAYVIPRFYPFKGGAEQNFYALASRMANQGHDVTIITTDVRYRNEVLPKEEIYKGMKIVRHHAISESLYAGFYPELLSYLWKNDFDVIHASGIGFLWREFCLILKKLKVRKKTRFIVTPHGGFMVLNDNTGFRGLVKKYYTFVLRIFLNRLYDAVIQINPKQKKWMNEEYGIDKEKIYLIPNGIDESYLETRLVKHEPNEKVIITYMNRMEWYKGVQDVIKALDSLLRSDRYKKNNVENHNPLPEFEFYIMGRAGNYTPKLKELVEKLKMEQYIKFIYSPSDEERDRIFYEESQINILPSKYENYGITLIESMAKGNSIITTYGNEGAYMFLKENVNGFIYEFGNIEALTEILYKLISDYELRQEMRKYNLKYAAEFTWETVFPDYIKLIEDLISAL